MEKKKVLLGITGGIAAYKSAELARLLVKAEFEVRVIMTRSAAAFVAPLTFEALCGNEVAIEMFPREGFYATRHIDLADWANVFVVAPATANFLAKAATGICDNLLTTTFTAAKCPVLIAPAMNSNMWDYPAVLKNVEVLRGYGFHIIDPESGDLACGWVGKGRMAEPQVIFDKTNAILEGSEALKGKKALVTASRTEEPIDSVRYISNRSSGKMGYAIAERARDMGAETVLISGPSNLREPGGIEVVKVMTAEEMASAVKEHFADCDLLVMSAAVSDYTPSEPYSGKRKKSDKDLTIELKPTEDILKSVSRNKDKQVIIGFALETDDQIENAQKKLKDKRIDIIVLNNPNEEGAGFDVDTNRVDIIGIGGKIQKLPLMSKRELAREILERAVSLLKGE
ncbi:MAG: bifunctional phosphopantothenoylcysteine decarboxylase/phosphopantothenate--cysteine ligase CoaBC [candidate division Zixibacteria bacterium]|nr:bifunctional phosphopantothenoylcysteine decarboxylase/phosphopantothenate--cysteine ligase CoaBC [candidate division Zixibacteria bacterium]